MTFENLQRVDFEGCWERVWSSYQMPSEENKEFAKMKKTLKQLFAEHAEKDKIKSLYNTNRLYEDVRF